ncbi:MAG TPA: TIGR04255 family protein [Kofleriaceae bacterium]|nr:TIGR04255 family protein [Kofleriaceae bacterium]
MIKPGHLSSPPITEVICGVIFESIRDLDPLVLGLYWETRRREFPNHQLQPPIGDDPAIVVAGLAALRTWLLSNDDTFVIQIQQDRFYLNWRARGQAYPRFSDTSSEQGILSRFLFEFSEFSAFCDKRLGLSPVASRIELAKVDHFIQGEHWSDFRDLSSMLPWLSVFTHFSSSDDPLIALRFTEEIDGGRLAISLDSAMGERSDQTAFKLMKLETRVVRTVSSELRTEYMAANDHLNRVFFAMIPAEQREARFNRHGGVQ